MARSGEDARRASARKGDPQRTLGFDEPAGAANESRPPFRRSAPPVPVCPPPEDPRNPIDEVWRGSADRFERRWVAFVAKNRHVLRELLRLARRQLREQEVANVERITRGEKPRPYRLSMKQQCETLRNDRRLVTDTGEHFKLNNDLTGVAARYVMAIAPDLEGCYELRARASERVKPPD